MTNEQELSNMELIGIAQVYATLALGKFTFASMAKPTTDSMINAEAEARILSAKARLIIEQAERRGLDAAE